MSGWLISPASVHEIFSRKQVQIAHKTLRLGALATLSRNFQMEFLQPLLGRPDVELILQSGNTAELLMLL
jgi:LysR family transcriptional activator of nhaA